MIPMNDRVRVFRGREEADEWGIPVSEAVGVEYIVRLDFNGQSRLVQTPDGDNVMFKIQVFFKGAVEIDYTDYIEYDSRINGRVKDTPKKISPIVDLSGKVTYTQVML